jgi:hypothetical protein
MAQGYDLKQIEVEQDPWMSLIEGGILYLRLPAKARILCLSGLAWPDVDWSYFNTWLKFAKANKPKNGEPYYIFVLGHFVNDIAIKSLWDKTGSTYISEYVPAPEILKAQKAGNFDQRVAAAGHDCGHNLIKRIADETGAHVVVIPGFGHFRIPNEARLMKWINRRKKKLMNEAVKAQHSADKAARQADVAAGKADKAAGKATEAAGLAGRGKSAKEEKARQAAKKAKQVAREAATKATNASREAKRAATAASGHAAALTDVTAEAPHSVEEFLDLKNVENVTVLGFGSAIAVNDDSLFLPGYFKRRNPGDAAMIELAQREFRIIVRPFGFKTASSWLTAPKHTLPDLDVNFLESHEFGFMWNQRRMGQLGDYDKYTPSFWGGQLEGGDAQTPAELFGESVPFVIGDDQRRSFTAELLDAKAYTESTAAASPLVILPKNIPAAHIGPPMGAQREGKKSHFEV